MNYAVVNSVIIAALIIAHAIECRRDRPRTTPKIWVKSYIEQDGFGRLPAPTEFQNADKYENIYVSKNGSEYVISSNVLSVDFACESGYPITWKLPNVQQFSGVTNAVLSIRTEIISNYDNSLAQPQNTKYYAYLGITATQNNYGSIRRSLSGDLACHKIDNPSIQSAIYVYTEVQSSINYSGETTQVNVVPPNYTVVIPCRPTLPTMSLSLFKENHNDMNTSSSFWVPIYPSASVAFDPHIGFTLDLDGRSLVVDGKYKCVVDGEEETAYSIFQVGVGGAAPSFDFKPTIKITSNRANFSFGNNLIKCCSGNSSFPANGDSYGCVSQAECDLLKPVFMYDVSTGVRTKKLKTTFTLKAGGGAAGLATKNTDCYQTAVQLNYLYKSKLFLCNGQGIHVVGHYVSAFPDEIRNALSRRRPYYGQSLKLFDLSHPNSLTVANKIVLTIDVSYLSRYRYIIEEKLDSIRNAIHKAHYIEQYRRAYTPSHGGLFEGESFKVTCVTHPYFYAQGAWLRLNWKNGSTTVLRKVTNSALKLASESGGGVRRVNHLYDLGDYEARVGDGIGDIYKNSITGKIPQTSMEMESVDCFSPVWNSDQWEMHTYKLQTKAVDLPEIEPFSRQSVTLTVNQTGIQINCTLKHSNLRTPYVSFYWEKDGKVFRKNPPNGMASIKNFNAGNTTISTLLIPVVTLASQGEYHCVAENVKGQVRKKYTIFVDDERGSGGAGVVIFGICVILLGTLVGVLIWRHWHLRKSISRLLSR